MRRERVTRAAITRVLTLRGALLLPFLALLPPHRAPGRVAPGLNAAAPFDTAQRARALHLLNRLTFGPRPGDVDRVSAMGIERYLDEQLYPERIPDLTLEQRLGTYDVLEKTPADLARVFAGVVRERREAQRSRADSSDRPMDPGDRRGMAGNPMRRLLGEYQQVTMVRAVLSDRQLYEVMVDFWSNHFNVFIGKGADRFLLPGYIEQTIRPRALGTFEDLLLATAQSPAMLFYLDNAQSVAPGSRPPRLDRLQAARAQRGRIARRGAAGNARMDSVRAQVEARVPKGINENYARELMELHTLGVDGGYTQKDVENLARILTGWSIARTRQSPEFVFNDWAHDRGAKTLLGRAFPSGHGQDEGLAALRMLARHPSTMRHVTTKLCARFVSDDVSDGCVDAGVRAWQRTGGDIREVIRAIVTSPEFWEAQNRASKIKTPLEFVVSAVRAVGGEPDSSLALAQVVARLGQPLFGQQAPTGYPETRESWVNAGALLQRMNVALGLATGRLPGTTVRLDAIAPGNDDIEKIVQAVNATVLNGTGSANTLGTLRHQAADLTSADQRRAMIVALALGSPEFQKQ
jgi:uncharacterized protein (DUF1800 family)